MPTFGYRRRLEMPPRPGVKYATTYIKQDPRDYHRLRNWLVEIGETIMATCQRDPELAEWFQRPMPDFRRSIKGQYYSPQDLLEDMLQQMALERDVTQAMIDRWNRLTDGTPWQIYFDSDAAVARDSAPAATIRL
jgi:hypothetical protein